MSLFDHDATEIIGKAGRDAEQRFLPNGTAVTSFTVAVDRSYKKDGQQVKRTIWYKVSVFGNFAEVCAKYVKKGGRVFVRGELTPDENGNPKIWTKQDGTPGASFEVNASTVRFLSGRDDGPEAQAGNARHASDYVSGPPEDDQIPF